MKRLLIVFMLFAVPVAARDVRPPLSEQAVEAARLRVQADRWSKVADRSMFVWGMTSAASLATTSIEEHHPRRTRTINIMWTGSAVVWLVAHLREQHLCGRLAEIEEQ